MMFSFPQFYPPFYRRYPKSYYNSYYYTANKVAPPPKVCEPVEEKSKSSSDNDVKFFEILGIKLYFDDILIICLLFFLYNEGVKDQSLFIALIMLLLS